MGCVATPQKRRRKKTINDQELKALPAPGKGSRTFSRHGQAGLRFQDHGGRRAGVDFLNYAPPSGVGRRGTLVRFPNLSLAQARAKTVNGARGFTDGVLVREEGAERRKHMDPLEEQRRERSETQKSR